MDIENLNDMKFTLTFSQLQTINKFIALSTEFAAKYGPKEGWTDEIQAEFERRGSEFSGPTLEAQ